MTPGTEQRKLAALLFTDMVGSTALKQQMGDKAGLQLIGEHHELLRQILRQFAGAEEIKTAGDSFFLSFPTPSAAVSFAVRLLMRSRQFNAGRGVSVQDRVGIHLGEVSLQSADDGPDLHGLHVDLCARVMGLAQGGQILMTRAVFDSARHTLKGEDLEGVAALNWVSHGRYLLKGLDEPLEICEVAESGQEALRPPDITEKARRHTSPEEEPVLGWRPAVEQPVGRTDWVLEEKLGEGGFGEVWVGRHRRLKERRVFKFCFRADRVRSLKREMTLFRLIKERIGDHPNIVSLREVYFDEPPYYVEMDYAEGQDLASWCAAQGGAEKVGLETKLEIVAQVAEALQAAHECGVIHRDVKPGNILVSGQSSVVSGQSSTVRGRPSTLNSQPLVKLTDFGIGQVISGEYLADVTKAGFTQTMMSSGSSHTGTQLYLAPELMAGEPATTRSDLYSLGVVFYQLVVGAFNRPLTSDWAQDITDPLLRDDIRHCVVGKPEDRFAGAGQLAKHLRDYAQRKAELERREAEKAALERAAYRRGMMRTAGVAALIVAVMAGLALVALNQSRRALAGERLARRHRYAADMILAQQALDAGNLGRVKMLIEEYSPAATNRSASASKLGSDLRGWEWRHIWSSSQGDQVYTLGTHGGAAVFVVFSDDGSLLATADWDRTMKLWDVAARREIATVRFPAGPADLCFVGKNRTVAIALGKEIWLVDGATGHQTDTISCLTDVKSMAFSQDGSRLAIYQSDTLRLLDARSRRELWRTNLPTGWRVVFSPDSSLLAAATDKGRVLLLEAASGQQLESLPGFKRSWLGALLFSPDGALLACASGSGGDALNPDRPLVRVWEVKTLRSLPAFPLEDPGRLIRWFGGIAFSPDGTTIAISGGPHFITLVDRHRWQVTGRLQGHLDEAMSVAYSPDGKMLVGGGKDGVVLVWDAAPKPRGDAALPLPGATDAFRLSADGRKLCVLTTNNTYAVWESSLLRQVAEGPLPFTNILHTAARGFTTPWAVSSDGRRLFNVTPAGQIIIWDTRTRQSSAVLEQGVTGLLVVALSPDEKMLAVGGTNGIVSLWDLPTRTLVTNLPAGPDSSSGLVFSQDSQHLAVGFGDGQLEVWHRSVINPLWSKLWRAEGHTLMVQALAMSRDNRFLVSGGPDGRANLWDLKTGKLIKTLSGAIYSSYNCVAISHDGKRVYGGGVLGTLSVWDTDPDSLQCVGMFKGHREGMGAVVVIPETDDVVSVGYESPDNCTVRLWRAPSLAEIEAAEKEKAQRR